MNRDTEQRRNIPVLKEVSIQWAGQQPFDAHDTRDIPGYNLLKQAWDKPLPHEDPLMDEERRLLSVAQVCRDYVEGKRHE